MASKIVLKKSSVAAKVPVVGDLDFGELAINYTDGKLYFKKADNTIDAFTTAAASAPVTSVGGNVGDITDAQLLASIKNVDGTGSGLDADTLDGNHASAFYLASNPNGYTSNTGTVTSVGATAPLVSSGGTAPSISIPAANSTTNGYMSSAYASKLDGIAAGANNYTLPTATSTVLGGIELFSDTVQTVAANAVTATASRTYGVQLNSSGQAVVNVPWTDTNSGGTVTSIATSGAITGGTITTTGTISHSTADGFLHVPATGTTNSGKVLTAGATAGSLSWTTPTTGTVTSVSGTGSYGGLTLSGTVTGSGNITLGGTPTGTWPISVSGNSSTASTLQTARNINGISFNGSANIDTTEWFHSDRDFPNGTLITTNINYAVTYGDPFVLEIRGNSYGNIVPLDLLYQGYIYSDTIINHGGISNGLTISGLVAINNGGNLCFWFPNQGYWNGYNVKVYTAYATRAVNRVTSITGVAKPTTAKEVALSANIRQSLHSGNYTSYSPSLTGSGASGTWGINITGNAATASSTTVVGVHSGNEVNLGGGYAGGGTLYVNYNDGGSYTNISFYNGGTSLSQLTASQFNGALNGNATTASSATYATYINTDSYNMKLHWSGQSGQPTWLWGSNNGTDGYVWNPSNFSVNYANSAGSASSISGSAVMNVVINHGGSVGSIGVFQSDTATGYLADRAAGSLYVSPSDQRGWAYGSRTQPSGTWRCLGYTPVSNLGSDGGTCVWCRIA